MRSSAVRLFILLLGLFVLTSCGSGGGGGGGVLPEGLPGDPGDVIPGPGSSAGAVSLGIIGMPVSHAGSVTVLAPGYYTFKTDSGGGKYSFSMKNTNSELMLELYSNADFSNGHMLTCDNLLGGGDFLCATQFPDLSPNTDYYIKITEWNMNTATYTYTLGISRVDSEGTSGNPVLLTVGTPHSGSIDAVGSSYYYFQTSSAGEYGISISSVPGMGSVWVSIDIFETDFTDANLVKSCSVHDDPVCTVNGLAGGAFYYVRVNQNGTSDMLYTIRADRGASEGSTVVPVVLTYGGPDHQGAADGNGSSYYTFTPTNSGDSLITLTTASALQMWVYSDPAFTSGQLQWCNFLAGGVCTVSNVNQGVPYYLLITNYAASDATYAVRVGAGSNEGSLAHPIDITADQPHSGSVDGHGTSYYTFTTTLSGSYKITLNTTLSQTFWSLYKDQNFTQPVYSISTPNNTDTIVDAKCSTACTTYYYQDSGKTYYNLDANTTYYLAVNNDSAVTGTFTLAEATGAGNAEGSINDPVVLTQGTPWPGRVGAQLNSYYTFTPSLSANYLIRLTNVQDTTGLDGMTLDLYSDAGYVTSLGYCSSRSYYTTSTGDVICSTNSFSSLLTLTAGTPYSVKLHNNEFYTANAYSITVSPYAPSLGCNSGGAACYTFESGIPGNFVNNPATSYPSDSGWATAASSLGTGSQSILSTKPNGKTGTYRSCFAFDAANIKWIGYSAQVATSGYDSLSMYVYNSAGTLRDTPTLVYGNAAWQRKVYIPPQDAYTYEWCYEKQSNATGDAAWVDDIELH